MACQRDLRAAHTRGTERGLINKPRLGTRRTRNVNCDICCKRLHNSTESFTCQIALMLSYFAKDAQSFALAAPRARAILLK